MTHGMMWKRVGVDVGFRVDRDYIPTFHQVLDLMPQILACISFMPRTLMILAVFIGIVVPRKRVRRSSWFKWF